MQEYHDLVKRVLSEGKYKPNARTGVDTISYFSTNSRIDLSEGFPLLTTKKMDGARWKALIHEFLWYISGEEHIKNLRQKTKIWDAWANSEGHLETAYGRFWRRFPLPQKSLPGEVWADKTTEWVTTEPDGTKTFDQLKYVINLIKTSPSSRRMIVTAWHPANASVSKLPPCHYTFAFNVQDDKLHLHMTQRSCDIALGVPFNIAAYSLMCIAIAQQTGYTPGLFGHSLIDAHIYCGKGPRGQFYNDALPLLQEKIRTIRNPQDYLALKEHLEKTAPPETENERGLDHIPGLLEQISRAPYKKPDILIAHKPLDDLTFDDIKLTGYQSHPKINFKVAE